MTPHRLDLRALQSPRSFLAAGRFAPELAAASSLRWLLASASLTLMVLSWARPVKQGSGGLWRPAYWSIGLAVPVMIASGVSAVTILGGGIPAGPLADSWFAHLLWSSSHEIPLAAIAIMFLGYAARERRSEFALAAGILTTIAVGIGYSVERALRA